MNIFCTILFSIIIVINFVSYSIAATHVITVNDQIHSLFPNNDCISSKNDGSNSHHAIIINNCDIKIGAISTNNLALDQIVDFHHNLEAKLPITIWNASFNEEVFAGTTNLSEEHIVLHEPLILQATDCIQAISTIIDANDNFCILKANTFIFDTVYFKNLKALTIQFQEHTHTKLKEICIFPLLNSSNNFNLFIFKGNITSDKNNITTVNPLIFYCNDEIVFKYNL